MLYLDRIKAFYNLSRVRCIYDSEASKIPYKCSLIFESGDPSGICESYMDNF